MKHGQFPTYLDSRYSVEAALGTGTAADWPLFQFLVEGLWEQYQSQVLLTVPLRAVLGRCVSKVVAVRVPLLQKRDVSSSESSDLS